ncbi:MAG: DUF58 domain-containing protein [Planctomycetaceae bacterium]|nr:DUF58 domain-containing protein [Planctomycetaceae bacterium]
MTLHSIDQRLRQLQLRTRYPVEHLLAGEYRSVFKGRGMDFDEICAYHPGDEVRSIDWNVTARTGRPYIKRYIEERELAVWLVVDVSASCRIAAPGRTKWDAMHELAALVAISAIHNHDRVGMILCSDRVEQILQPRKGRQHALRLLNDLLAVEPRSPGSDPAPALDALLHMARRRVLVLMLSDFLFDLDREQLGPVAFRHDLVGIAVNHPSEIEPPPCGLAAVRDSETGEAFVADFGHTGRDVCKDVFDQRRRRLRDEFSAVRADLLELDTRASCAEELARFFRHRLRRTADETGG